MRYILVILFLLTKVFAVGPTRVATFDRALWNEPINTKSDFNKASRHEIISYVNQIIHTDLSSKEKIKAFVLRKNVSVKSLQQWKDFTQNNLLKNFKEAQQGCQKGEALCAKVLNWNDLAKMATAYIPSQKLTAWYNASQTFFSYYLYEQARLAAIFQKITSEIHKLDPSEMQGFSFQDGEFLLTFDDGPQYVRTDAINTMLRNNNIHGLFFVLGNHLQASIKKYGAKKIANLYQGSCVGSHGFMHKSHQRLKNWQSSYDKTRELIHHNGLNNHSIWFRPPYGQRHKMLIKYLAKRNDKIMLWNIDSQDWNRKLSAKQIEDRVLTLMLLHRKGIILFHDIHPKAIKVIKSLNHYQGKSIEWIDCKTIKP